MSAPRVSAHAAAPTAGDFGDLLTLVTAATRTVALTGAGMSTDSGIPDYRGPNSPARSPMTYQEFVSGPTARQRYWARSHLGWGRMFHAEPNAGHHALAALEHHGVVRSVITQNVDGLHQQGGSRSVVDLHGRIDEVVCLQCGEVTDRASLHARLDALNPDFGAAAAVRFAPDGDVDFEDTQAFRTADCLRCGGTLKPHVVFFGENVPKDKVAHCYAEVEAADLLLVTGSSLTVQSGLRFVRRAYQRGTPVAIVNRGVTRGDPFATVRLELGCSETLTSLAAELGCAG